MSEQPQHADMAPEHANLDFQPSENTDSTSSKLVPATESTAQKRSHQEDSISALPPVKRGRGRPRKHPIISKDGTVLGPAPKCAPTLFKEALEPEHEELCTGKRISQRIQEIKEQEEEREEEEMTAYQVVIPLCKPLTKYKLWDMRQTKILLAHVPTKMPPPHHGSFGETLGFKGGNYEYEQDKRIYEAKVELAETGELELDDDSDTDKKEMEHKNAHVEEEGGVVEFVRSKSWEADYEEWLSNPNE